MASSRGGTDVKRYMAQTRVNLETKVLRGAARAGANIVAEEAKDRANSIEVKDGLAVGTRKTETGVIARVYVKGRWAQSLGLWAEYGTDPHFIRVDDSQRAGRSIGRINRLAKAEGSSHSLVIGGTFVGATVLHPGAQAHPFLRVSLDVKEAEAFAAAQSYITANAAKASPPEPEADDR